MMFCHLGWEQSLAEITGGLAGSEGKFRRLGVTAPPKKSTLACANEYGAGRCTKLCSRACSGNGRDHLERFEISMRQE